MSSFINITSEIGKLNKVMLHRPGAEIENLVPEYLERLLFDDIPFLKVAREEHDRFAQILRENGTEVFYLEELTAETLEDDKIKKEFLEEFLTESKITSQVIREALMEYLLKMSTREMVDTLMAGVRKEAIEVKEATSLIELMQDSYPFYLDPMPNLYFTRDPAASMGSGMTINTMKTEARRRETLFLTYIHKYHKNFANGETSLWYNRTLPYSIEGGDELILSDKVVAIGCSDRTSAEAIEIVAKGLFAKNESFEKVLVFDIPNCRAFMHLDTVFTMVDYDKFTIHPQIQGPLSVYEVTKGQNGTLRFKHHTDPLEKILASALEIPSVELIQCGGGDFIIAGREQWNDGSNTLAIAPGTVVTYERNYVSNELLAKRGINVLTMPSAELSRGRGGPRCMSMPLHRDNLR
ncbi:TPA: arginine deiminase [Clostridium sporogenes]|uniref:arginine deiminase n=1 Tax=Clostridium sporogenes TaxID=1509 RepID=UPI002238942C|nr:arginine deiminase [Clostridium sporogenes]MCW6109761.1 arginine deiminase [Clostridium sporogenes]